VKIFIHRTRETRESNEKSKFFLTGQGKGTVFEVEVKNFFIGEEK
jgi:hypothetical protein